MYAEKATPLPGAFLPQGPKPVFLRSSDIRNADKKSLTGEELYKSILNVVKPENISGIQEIRHLWRIYLSSHEDRVLLIANGLELRDTSVPIHDVNPFTKIRDEHLTRVVVKDIPLSLSDDVIRGEILAMKHEIKGEIYRQRLRVNGQLTNCLNGDRILYITPPTKPLPRKITFGNLFTGRVYHDGQPQQPSRGPVKCSRCLEVGHHVSTCTGEVKCIKCNKYGHMKSACPGGMSPNREATADATEVHVHSVKETPKPQHVAIDISNTPQQLREVRDPPATSYASDGAIDNRGQRLYKSRVNNGESVASASSSESDSDILSDESTLSAETPPKTSLKGRKAAKRKRKGSNKKKSLLCDEVKVKVETFEITKTRNQSAEEYLKAFLEAEVKPLWPKDWIQTRNLFKESRAVHDHVTYSAGKQRKGTSGAPRKLLMTTAKKTTGVDVMEGSGTAPQGSSETQEFEPSSTQINEMVGSPVTTKHVEDVPTLVDYMGSGEDSMDAVISSSHQLKGTEYATASSDSNQEASPSVAPGQSVPVSSSSPLPNLDPNFLEDQLMNQQRVTDSQDARPRIAGASGTSNVRTGDMNVRVQGTNNTAMMPETAKLAAMSTGEMLPQQAGLDSLPSQQSYSAKLSAISNIHSMRTMHQQEPGVQAKDVTSSSMMGKVRPTVSSVPRSEMHLGQPVIRLTKDSRLEKMTSQSSSRMKVQGTHSKGQASVPKTQTVHGGVHSMPYSQSPSNTSLQGRSSNVSTQRLGGGMDPLPQMSTQVAPGNGNIRLSPSSQSTSRRTSYVSPTNPQQRAGTTHSPGSAFSTPSPHSHHMKTSQSIPQQTSPSAMGAYSNTSRQYTSPHQQYSSGHTSPIAAYSTASPSSYQAMGGSGSSYQQMPLSDMTARQQSSGGANFNNSYPIAQSSSQGGVPQSPAGDAAVITGPAPGTFYHQSPTDPRYVGDSSSSQHRIH